MTSESAADGHIHEDERDLLEGMGVQLREFDLPADVTARGV